MVEYRDLEGRPDPEGSDGAGVSGAPEHPEPQPSPGAAYEPPANTPPACAPPAYGQPWSETPADQPPRHEPAPESRRYAPPAYAHGPAPAGRERTGGGGRVFLVALLGAVVGAALTGALLVLLLLPVASRSSSTANSGPVLTTTPRSSAVLATQPIEIAAADALPSVVNIAVTSSSGSGVGSGVIVRSSGYILTNFHVVDGANSITVSIGTTSYTAHVVGTDQVSDLAVVKVDKTGLRAAVIGQSADLVIGETVLAVGSPFGLDKTVTSGIVSALHRSNIVQGSSTGVAAYQDLIQTDAAINPGNSGGALVDMSGAVVGINTLIESPSGQLGASQSAGIGFAIPIDYAINIADQLISGVAITHPYVGITAATVSPGLAQLYGLPRDSGALVTQVDSGSPAARAGIRPGDIVTAMGSVTINSADELYVQLLKEKVGTAIEFHVTHLSGSTSTVPVTPVAR